MAPCARLVPTGLLPELSGCRFSTVAPLELAQGQRPIGTGRFVGAPTCSSVVFGSWLVTCSQACLLLAVLNAQCTRTQRQLRMNTHLRKRIAPLRTDNCSHVTSARARLTSWSSQGQYVERPLAPERQRALMAPTTLRHGELNPITNCMCTSARAAMRLALSRVHNSPGWSCVHNSPAKCLSRFHSLPASRL